MIALFQEQHAHLADGKTIAVRVHTVRTEITAAASLIAVTGVDAIRSEPSIALTCFGVCRLLS